MPLLLDAAAVVERFSLTIRDRSTVMLGIGCVGGLFPVPTPFTSASLLRWMCCAESRLYCNSRSSPAAAVIGNLLLGRLSDWKGRNIATALAMGTVGVTLVAVAFAGNKAILVTVLVLTPITRDGFAAVTMVRPVLPTPPAGRPSPAPATPSAPPSAVRRKEGGGGSEGLRAMLCARMCAAWRR